MDHSSNPLDPGYFCDEELKAFGFGKVGVNVSIAKNVTAVGLENIYLGNNIRIDGPAVLSATEGFLNIGSNVHIGSGSHLICKHGISIGDYSTLSQGVKLYSVSDDYSGGSMTNPTIPKNFKNLQFGEIRIGSHVIIGSTSVVLPSINIGDGVAVGALSLVNKSLSEWGIYAGCPARFLRERSKAVLRITQEFENNVDFTKDWNQSQG